MKAKHVLMIGAFAAFTLGACKKEMPISPANPAVKNGKENMRAVQQKMCYIDAGNVMAAIRQFKGNASARLVNDDSIPADSSIWVIEAALNYDFDMVGMQSYEYETYTGAFDVPANGATEKVDADDIEDAYEQLSAIIAAHTDEEHKVEYVDVEATIGSTYIAYSVQFAVAWLVMPNNCYNLSPTATYLTSAGAMSSISSSLLTCGAPAGTPDAVATLNKKLNCEKMAFEACSYRLGYTNVGTAFRTSNYNSASNSYPAELFATALHNNCNWCSNPPGVLTLTGAQVTTYYNNLAQFALNLSPAGTMPIKCTVGWGIATGSTTPSCGVHKSFGWDYTVKYGTPTCLPWPID